MHPTFSAKERMDKNKTKRRESNAMNVKALNIFRLNVHFSYKTKKDNNAMFFHDEYDVES